MSFKHFAISLSALVSLLLSAAPAYAIASIKVTKLSVSGTAINNTVTGTLTPEQIKVLKQLTLVTQIKSATATNSASVITKEKALQPSSGSSAFAASNNWDNKLDLTPTEFKGLGDKATMNIALYDSTNKTRKLLAQTSLSFAVSANVVPDNVATFKAWYTIEEKNGQLTGTVSWEGVKNATHYTISRINTGKAATVVANSLSNSNSEDITTRFQNLEATDKFVVTAYQQDANGAAIMLAQGAAVEAGVVRAHTEFGNLANLGEYIQRVMKYALPVGVTLAVIMGMYAGITLMISQGAPDKIKNAKEGIQGAIVGLIILILVRLMVDFLYIPSIDTVPNSPSFFSMTTTVSIEGLVS